MADPKPYRRAFWIPLFVHLCVGLALYGALVTLLPRFRVLYAALRARGELPPLTDCVLRLYECRDWLFPIGFILDGAVLFLLSRLPRKAMWAAQAWFIAAVVTMAALFVVTAYDSVEFLIEMMRGEMPGQP